MPCVTHGGSPGTWPKAAGSDPFGDESESFHPQRLATIAEMAEEQAQPLEQQLEEIGAQLAWVRDYL